LDEKKGAIHHRGTEDTEGAQSKEITESRFEISDSKFEISNLFSEILFLCVLCVSVVNPTLTFSQY
jgi:hypothetical protein